MTFPLLSYHVPSGPIANKTRQFLRIPALRKSMIKISTFWLEILELYRLICTVICKENLKRANILEETKAVIDFEL